MCIAILNTKKAGALPISQLKNSWDNNDMGAGLLWVENGKLNVFKSYDYYAFNEKYFEIRNNQEVGNIVLHYRIATSGYKGEHNLHPFLVSDELGFVHNGVIAGLGNKEFSDTYEFNDMLKKFKHDFLKCEMTKYFISTYIGYSKLLFLDANDRYTIINEEKGHWKDDNWYSNTSYQAYNDYVWAGNEKVSKTSKHVDYVNDDVYEEVDEWALYEDLCDIYQLEPEDEASYEFIDKEMELNNCLTLADLWEFYYYDSHSTTI